MNSSLCSSNSATSFSSFLHVYPPFPIFTIIPINLSNFLSIWISKSRSGLETSIWTATASSELLDTQIYLHIIHCTHLQVIVMWSHQLVFPSIITLMVWLEGLVSSRPLWPRGWTLQAEHSQSPWHRQRSAFLLLFTQNISPVQKTHSELKTGPEQPLLSSKVKMVATYGPQNLWL